MRSLDFTACELPCKNPCWRRLTKEEIEWLEKNPNWQAYTNVCIEKNINDYKKGYEDGKEYYEYSYPFEKRNIEGKPEDYHKGFNDGYNNTLDNEYYNGYDVEVQE